MTEIIDQVKQFLNDDKEWPRCEKSFDELTKELGDNSITWLSSLITTVESQQKELDKKELIHGDYRRTALDRIANQEQQIESQKEEIEELSREEVTISFNCDYCGGEGLIDVSGNTGVEDDIDSCEECNDGSNDVKFTHEDIAKMYLDLQVLKAITELAVKELKVQLEAAKVWGMDGTVKSIKTTLSEIKRLQNG